MVLEMRFSLLFMNAAFVITAAYSEQRKGNQKYARPFYF
jgi:hypothetical protein